MGESLTDIEAKRALLARVAGIPALSVRQPWAWLLAKGWKDFENRDWLRRNPGRKFRGEVLIHASSGMTKDEYALALAAVGAIEVALGKEIEVPAREALLSGGIIGKARVVEWLDDGRDQSLWSGGSGLVIEDAEELPFIPCGGKLGFFTPSFPWPGDVWELTYFPKAKEKGWRADEKRMRELGRLKDHVTRFGTVTTVEHPYLKEATAGGEPSTLEC